MVGIGEVERDGCEFGVFFEYDATPLDLLQQRGIYNSSDTRRLEPWDSVVEHRVGRDL